MSSCIEFANRVIPNRSPKDRREYAEALLQCRIQPAYHITTTMGEYPCDCYPLMEWDTKGWTTVTRKVRVKKVWTNEELDEEANLDNWDYVFTDIAAGTVGNFTLDSIATIDQRDEVIGNPNDPASYSEINFGQEKYAAGIGMVYRRFFHNEYQPGGNGYFADGSYGVTYTMIDHN